MNRSELTLSIVALSAVAASVVYARSSIFGSQPAVPEPPKPSSVPLASLEPLAQVLQAGKGSDTVVEALDYQCPPCHAMEAGNRAYREAHPEVRWLVIQFPLEMHHKARPLSVLALAAAKNGIFPRFHDAAMSQVIRSSQSCDEFMSSVDSGLTRFAKENGTETPQVKELLGKTTKLPITGTPTLMAFRPDGASLMLHAPQQLEKFFSHS